MLSLPGDPVMLLSYVNTKLRDEFDSLDELCACMDADKQTVVDKLSAIGYVYSVEANQFK